MKLLDVNILLYAVDRDADQHDAIRDWLEESLQSEVPIFLSWIVILGFVRISTHPRVFANPLTIERAVGFIDDLLAHQNVRVIAESEQHWSLLRRLVQESGTAGNLTTDAHLAALAISHDAVLYSCDADFARFSLLKWKNPLALV